MQCEPDRTGKNKFTPEVIKAAIDHKFEGVTPDSDAVASLLPRVAKALKRQLKPRGDKLVIDGEDGEAVSVRRTGFGRIFKHSKDKQFSVSLAGGQTVTRSRSEVETHALLQSYLKTRYGDTGIRQGEVLQEKAPSSHPQGVRRKPFQRSSVPTMAYSAPIEHAASLPLQVPLMSPDDREVLTDSDSEPMRQRQASAASGAIYASDSDASLHQQAPAPAPAPAPSASTGNAAAPHQAPLNNHQLQTVQFIESRLQLSPLAFLDQVSRQDPVVAAFFAVQTAKMLTRAGPCQPPDSVWKHSAHPDMLVKDQIHSGAANRSEVRFKDPEKQAAALRKVPQNNMLMLALLEDLKLEMAQQNRMAGHQADLTAGNASALAMGIRTEAGAAAGNAHYPTNLAHLPTNQRVAHVVTLFERLAANNGANAENQLKAMAAVNPAAAAFCGVLDEMFLLKGGGTTEASMHRFPYFAQSCEMADLPYVELANGERRFETFVPGVGCTGEISEENCNLGLLNGNTWMPAQSKSQLVAHVAKEALQHMAADALAPHQQAYPLMMYELLGQATNTPVPQHLKDAEASAHATVAQNKERIEAKRVSVAALQKSVAEANAIAAEEDALRFRANNVSGRIQNLLTYSFFDIEKVTKDSVDCTFPLAPNGTTLAMVRGFQENQLAATHVRQAVSARGEPGGSVDNNCWARSSWLSILSSATPAMLSERFLQMIGRSDECTTNEAKIVHDIASRFRSNPEKFLHGANGNQSLGSRAGESIYLERGMLSSGVPVRTRERRKGEKTTEYELRSIQLQLSACYRFENPSMMSEIEAVFHGSQASSDLAINLHRSFNVPALVIEAGAQVYAENGERDLHGAQVRVAAPVGSELAHFITNAAATNLPLDEQSTMPNQLLERFKDSPVIWLEEGHYEVYLPKAMLEH